MQEGSEHIYPNHSIVCSHSALLELVLVTIQKKGLEEDYSQKLLQEENSGRGWGRGGGGGGGSRGNNKGTSDIDYYQSLIKMYQNCIFFFSI